MSHIAVIDPAVRSPELDAFNAMAAVSPLPLTHHFPSLFGLQSLAQEDLAELKGIIIMGSLSSVRERTPWQLGLEAWLSPLMERGTPTLGLCYGHQMLAFMHGARVDYVFEDRHKHLGLRDVALDETPFFAKASGPLVASHNEAVLDVPRNMRVIARSAACAIDGLMHERLPILSFQTHPEAQLSFLTERGLPPELAGPRLERLRFGHSLVRGFLEFAAKHPG